MEKLELLCIAGGNVKCSVTMKNSMDIPQKLNIELQYDPAISLLGIYSKDIKAGSRDIYTPILHYSQLQKCPIAH